MKYVRVCPIHALFLLVSQLSHAHASRHLQVQEDHFSFLYSLFMLLFDGILYILVIWYIDAVVPGRYGTAKPWYFPFQLSYWVGNSRAQRITSLFARKRAATRLAVSAEDDVGGDEEEEALLNPAASDTEGVCVCVCVRTYVCMCVCSLHAYVERHVYVLFA